MESAALEFAKSAVFLSIGKLASPYFGGDIIEEELQHLRGVILPKIQTVIAAADSINIDKLRPWIMHLMSAVYEAEDFLDLYEYKCLKSQVSSFPAAVKKFKKKAKGFLAPVLLKTELKKCFEKLKHSAVEANQWSHLVATSVSQRDAAMNKPLQSTVSSPSSPIFGRDGERDLLISKLMLPKNNYEDKKYSSNSYWKIPVIAVYGLGGAGKTTLARHIFNDPRTMEYFPSRLWVHVSRNLDMFAATKKIIESATKGECPRMESLDALQAHLKEHLKSKGKLLLVLDDVWLDEAQNREPFDQLMIPFNEVGDRGSKVPVTTRTERTALLMGVSVENIVPLRELEFLDCWSIVKHYAFGDAGIVIDDLELAQVGDSIIHKMKKSPLAAQMVGVQLGTKVDANTWRKILQGDILKSTKDVLLWSYKRLPAHLQQCFAFCSLFPKGWKFYNLDELVRFWVANGFVVPGSKCELTLEDLGRQYFDDLLSFTFFKSDTYSFDSHVFHSLDLSVESSFDSYVIHDLLHDLAEDVSIDHCYRIEGVKLTPIPKTIIHLSIHTEELITHMPAIINLVNLRTLIITFPFDYNFKNGNIMNKIFEKLSKLRVLHLGSMPIEQLHSSIGKLKLLQYLQLRLENKLPKSLGTAYHLKFLDLYGSKKSLPKELSNLINLRCLLVDACEGPNIMPEVGKLTSLNTLNAYPVKKIKGHEIRQLKNLELRGRLQIRGLENVKDKAEAVEARLKDKEHLNELSLEWTADSSRVGDQIDIEVLEGLEPPCTINGLGISYYSGVVSPSWLLGEQRGLPNLQHLGLWNCSKWKELPPLGQLPSLVNLYIKEVKAVEEVGLDVCCRSGGNSTILFPNLKSLEFSGMENWIRWSVPLGVEGVQLFPCLSELIIEDCPKLTGIPFLPPTLCVLNILKCPKLLHVPSLPPSLCDLRIRFCPDLMMELSPPFPPNLKILELLRCPGTKALIFETISSSSSSLESLRLNTCFTPDVMLMTCPSSLTSVIKFFVIDCESLTSLVLGDQMKALHILKIVGCKNLRSVEGIGSLPSLESLWIEECPMLVMSMEPIVYHVCCEWLSIKGCPNLSIGKRSAGEVVHCRSSIKSLEIDNLSQLEEMSQGLTSLSKLTIFTCENILSLPVSLLNSLKVLGISSCPELESLPDLGNLPFLQKLKISWCPKIESLPNLPSSLAELEVYHCHPKLKAKYKRGGPFHCQIAHIPKLLLRADRE